MDEHGDLTTPDGRRLLAWREPVRPSAREVAIYERAVRHARRHGVTIPPRVCEVFWFDTPEPGPAAETWNRRPVLVFLRRGLADAVLASVICHELRHVADLLAPRDLGKWEREARAQAFAQRAMADWQ